MLDFKTSVVHIVLRHSAVAILVLAMIVGTYWLARFISRLEKLRLVPDEQLEDLSHLIISGSTGRKKEERGWSYLLRRKYADLDDEKAVRYGDHARTWCWIQIGAAIVLAVTYL